MEFAIRLDIPTNGATIVQLTIISRNDFASNVQHAVQFEATGI